MKEKEIVAYQFFLDRMNWRSLFVPTIILVKRWLSH